MYKLFYSILTIVWILDIFNLPFMEFLDVVYPINGLVWFLIWISLPSTDNIIKYKNE